MGDLKLSAEMRAGLKKGKMFMPGKIVSVLEEYITKVEALEKENEALKAKVKELEGK
ncbi:MAG TPA: hypothetical protein PL033_05030 [Candidatus Brocadiia bacterium]|nr:hypothetical protein [Candidatus Brocadiia bacterium]